MVQLSNQFAMTDEKGMLTPSFGGVEASYNCQVKDAEATALVPGQAVKIVDVAGKTIRVTAATAATDLIFGFVPYNVKKASYAENEMVKISTSGTVMVMEASAAIAAGAKVEAVITGSKVVTQSTGTVIGTCLDKAAAAGDLVRVAITTIGQ